MRVESIDAFVICLPFRFAFKHSLASRSRSENLIVRCVISENGEKFIGYGEGIPRDYVTGETADGAVQAVKNEYAKFFLHREFADVNSVATALKDAFKALNLDSKPKGASWCGVELALLDAAAKVHSKSVAHVIAGSAGVASEIKYGAVIPFSSKRALPAMLWFYKFFGFQTVKLKVGKDLDQDLRNLQTVREILGSEVIIRVDANCAWTAEQAIRAAEKMRRFKVASYEQPVPGDDLRGLKEVSDNLPEHVLADESLCTVADARHLAEEKICSAFNIRVSKVGGLQAAAEIAEIARTHGIACHMGAQVGESAILSAAGRAFAATQPRFDNYEGSNNFFLLKNDISSENLNVELGGIGRLSSKTGLGITIIEDRLQRFQIQPSSLSQTEQIGVSLENA